MVKKTYLPEQIINKLREAEILLNQSATVGEGSAFYHNIVIALIDRDGMDRKIYGPAFVPETTGIISDITSLLS
jgi:hypothetical protein